MAPHNVLLVTSHLNVRNWNDPLFAAERARTTKPLISPHGIVVPSKRSDSLHSTTPYLSAGNEVRARNVDDDLLEGALHRSREMTGVIERLREYLRQVEGDSNFSSSAANWDEDSCCSSSSSDRFTTPSEGDPNSETSEDCTFHNTEPDDELPMLDDETIPSVARAPSNAGVGL